MDREQTRRRRKVYWPPRSRGVVTRPGLDIQANLPGGQLLVAECKGEPTVSGVKSGFDRTAFYEGIGQLIVWAGLLPRLPEVLVFAIPDTPRLRQLARDSARNPLLQKIGVTIVLVDEAGRVIEA